MRRIVLKLLGVAGWAAFFASLAGAYGVIWFAADALPEWIAWSGVAETFLWPLVLLISFGVLMVILTWPIERAQRWLMRRPSRE